MNGRLSAAGRASHYGTQFWRQPKRVYGSREALLKAHSKKSIDRRLVLPLDAHNWPRALEVLDAHYAKAARSPEHYQQVIRNMVDAVTGTGATATGGSRHTQEMAIALDGIRDRAYAEEIPVNSSLWVTLVWAQCALDQPQRALECYEQAQRRFTFSSAALAHMVELLVPVLATHGHLREAQTLIENCQQRAKARRNKQTQTQESGGVDGDGVSARHSLQDTQKLRRWLAEAAARSGDWATTLKVLEASVAPSPTSTRAAGRTVNSLFSEVCSPPGEKPLDDAKTAVSSGAHLSREALHKLFLSLATSGTEPSPSSMLSNTQRMLDCWSMLYGRNVSSSTDANIDSPTATDVCHLMNGLAQAGRWRDVLDIFSVYFFGKTGSEAQEVCLDHQQSQESDIPLSDVLGCSREGAAPFPLDEVAINLVFSAFPRCEVAMMSSPSSFETKSGAKAGGSRASSPVAASDRHEPALRLLQVQFPDMVVRLLDDLLRHHDDMLLTDIVMDTVGAALFQLGQFDRCLQLLRHTPAFAATAAEDDDKGNRGGPCRRRVTVATTPEARALRARLVNLVYAMHVATTTEVRYAAIMAFPFLFPPELLRALPAPDQMSAFVQAQLAREAGEQEKQESAGKEVAVSNSSRQEDLFSDEERYEAAMRSRPPSSVRPGRHRYFPKAKSTSALTEMQEAAMQRNYAALQHKQKLNRNAFNGRDADDDPRPIPKGLHDTASGWNFYGRGGEMVFANNTRIPHPFSMQPKVMRSLANPHRGWNPRQNSSLAHKESVIKWSGNSAV